MSSEAVLRNAILVLPQELVKGSVRLQGELIGAIDSGASDSGLDLEGDYLMPGLVELHTDHLESHYAPRPGVRWSMPAALQSHDAQMSTSGVTTLFDCLRLGSDSDDGFDAGEMRAMADTIRAAQHLGRLRCEHHLHLRCEVSAPDMLEHLQGFEQDEQVGLVSMMDHAPGQRQFACMEQYSAYHKAHKGMSDERFDRLVATRLEASLRFAPGHRRQLADLCRHKGILLASHDDATIEHVNEAVNLGVRLAEFPTTREAARASQQAGMRVLMGAPNLVRGGSHSGNVSALELVPIGALDVLSSDYIPFSLLQSAFDLALARQLATLPEAVAMITQTPAHCAGLHDRGSLQTGLRADLVQVRYVEGLPQVRRVWRAGRRVA